MFLCYQYPRHGLILHTNVCLGAGNLCGSSQRRIKAGVPTTWTNTVRKVQTAFYGNHSFCCHVRGLGYSAVESPVLGRKDICPMGDVSKPTRESLCGLVCGRTHRPYLNRAFATSGLHLSDQKANSTADAARSALYSWGRELHCSMCLFHINVG